MSKRDRELYGQCFAESSVVDEVFERIAQLEAALRAVEWDQWDRCVECHFYKYGKPDKHAPSCIVGKALKP